MTRRASLRSGAGYFAVGVWHPKTAANVGSLWRSATLYRAAFVFTIGRRYRRQASDTPATPRSTPLFHYADVPDLIGHLPWSCPLIGVEMDPAAAPLGRFAHPRRAVYLLGAEDHGLPPAILERCHRLVQVEAPGTESMNVACAGTVLMHARYLEEEKSTWTQES